MRVVVFTSRPALRQTTWWSAIHDTPEVTSVLLCERRAQDRSRALKLRKAIARYGPLYIPWRILRITSSSGVGVPAPGGRERASVSVHECDDINGPDVAAAISAFAPDIGLSIGAPRLARSIFTLPRLGTLNLHLGKVPHYRGTTPAFWEMVHGESEVGATIHFVTEELDGGPVLIADTAPIEHSDRLWDVEQRVSALGAALIGPALKRIAAGAVDPVAQPAGFSVNPAPSVMDRARLAVSLFLRRARRRESPSGAEARSSQSH